MGYTPFITHESHKLVDLEKMDPAAKGVTALIRRFDEGHYQKWQNALSAFSDEEKQDKEKRKKMTRDVLLDIGIMEWNFKDAKGKAVPLSKAAITELDATVAGFLYDEIYLHNPRFWSYLSVIDRKRLGIEDKVKNA